MTLPRLYAILDAGLIQQLGLSPASAAEAMLDGGVEMLQWRLKSIPRREDFDMLSQIAQQCSRAGASLIVNDRADLAMLFEAGLHVGQTDLPVNDARRLIGTTSMLGLSTHNEEQLNEASNLPADYVALGPVFATRSKETPDPEVGLDRLHRWRGLTSRPLVAIGGITRRNVLAVLDSGADSVAVISDLIPEELTKTNLRRRVEEWRTLLG